MADIIISSLQMTIIGSTLGRYFCSIPYTPDLNIKVLNTIFRVIKTRQKFIQ